MRDGRQSARADDVEQARAAALLDVEGIRSQIPSWQRSLASVAREALRDAPDLDTLDCLLDVRSAGGPAAAVAAFRTGEDARLLGPHVRHLVSDVGDAAKWWTEAERRIERRDCAAAASEARRAADALTRAMMHALYLTFLNDAQHGRVGERRDIAGYCQDWGLEPEEIDELWVWVTQDGLRLGDRQLPLVVDTRAQCVYRAAAGPAERVLTAATPLWGAALVYGVVALLFLVLDEADVTTRPANWRWQLLVLLVFVALGAVLHLGSRALNINYDDAIEVYAGGSILNWLSLRWLGVLRMYIPIAVVVAGVWAAGGLPASFDALGAAILAGYSADSLFRASVERVRANASRGSAAAPSG